MKLNKPGMRNIKTGIGVMLCILVGYFNIIDKTFFAAVACIVCMQTTVKSSLTVGLNRLKGTFIGGIMGFLFVLIRPGNPILACLGIIATIYICNILKVNSSITIACVVFCAIMINIGVESPLDYSIHRIIDTSIGIIIGVCVNYFIYRPKYLERIYNEIKIIESKSIELLKTEIEKGHHANISTLKDEITKLEGLYKNYLDELEYSIEDTNNEEINETIKRCKQIYLHLQVLENMKYKCYLDEETYIKTVDLCDGLDGYVEVKNDISPVYNYHIKMI
ncbi:FUSC family protein, partial [Romboutsia sp. 13368]|uniref:FUSC family protein n=1 Tax=Romboutsia sp. 13368 TaxID=2708053 RepID=UPI0025F90F01